MNQTAIGGYIARKRKEQNLTQEQLAQQLGVSNKTISKWENGKCMPDYSIIQKLCDVIHVSLPELMDGEDAAEDSVRVYDDEQILDLLRRTQELERQKGVLCGFVLIVLGIASSALSRTTGGSGQGAAGDAEDNEDKAAEDALLPFQLLRAAQQVENLFIVVDAHTVLRRILAVHQLRKRHMNYVAEFLDDAVIRHTLSVLPF